MSVNEKSIVNDVMYDFTESCKQLLGNNLVDVILYGSYARGDYQQSSDIDVMVLVNGDNNIAKNNKTKICNIACDIDSKYNYEVYISAFVQNQNVFDSPTNLYYNNIRKDGISFYA
ncbi:MAG: nucleotidyltransferase domain-containing protein [Oscillospiraceae bacterium]|nr:nucleotidyltransferase domain-containing protein [Oscillospiraceae bacterium]